MTETKRQQIATLHAPTEANPHWWMLDPPDFGVEGQLQCHPSRSFRTRAEALAEAARCGWTVQE